MLFYPLVHKEKLRENIKDTKNGWKLNRVDMRVKVKENRFLFFLFF